MPHLAQLVGERFLQCDDDAVGVPTARAAMSAPSSTAYGLVRRIMRSLNEPGSPSAAFTTTVAARVGRLVDADGLPLAPGGEARAAATAESGRQQMLDRPGGTEPPGRVEPATSTATLVVVEGQDRGFGEHPARAHRRGCSRFGPRATVVVDGCPQPEMGTTLVCRNGSIVPKSGGSSPPTAQLVEVLPLDEWESEHVAGARSIPLKELEVRAPSELDVSHAVIVYCYGYL